MSYQSITLNELITALAERTEQQPFWSSADATKAINEGLRIYNLITGMYRTQTSVPLIPDDVHVAVGGTLVKGTTMRVSGQLLTLTSIDALDRLIANWQGVNTASGGGVPTLPGFWAPIGITEIVIYPKIDPTLVGLTIEVDGVRNTPILAAGGDYLNMGLEEVSTLLGYALHVLSFGKGHEALRKTRPGFVAFIKACALRNAEFAASNLYRKMVGYDRLRSSQPMVNAQALQAGTALVQEETEQ